MCVDDGMANTARKGTTYTNFPARPGYRHQEELVLAITGGDALSTELRCWGYAPPLEPPLIPLPIRERGGKPPVPPFPTTQHHLAGAGTPAPGAWVPARRVGEVLPDGGGILFHCIILTDMGDQAPMMLLSWLATQVGGADTAAPCLFGDGARASPRCRRSAATPASGCGRRCRPST